MKMVSHQTIRDDFGAVLLRHSPHSFQKMAAVEIVGIDGTPVDAARHRVINRPNVMNPMCSTHTYHTIDMDEKFHPQSDFHAIFQVRPWRILNL